MALIVLLAFGSAATFMFWAKWLGKLSGIAARPENVEAKVHSSEWVAHHGHGRARHPVLHWTAHHLVRSVVEPYIYSVFGTVGQDISSSNLWIASILSAFIAVVLFAGLGRSKAKKVDIYLAGVSRDNAERTFSQLAVGRVQAASARNWYLGGHLRREAHCRRSAAACCTVIIVIAFACGGRGRFRDCSRKG